MCGHVSRGVVWCYLEEKCLFVLLVSFCSVSVLVAAVSGDVGSRADHRDG